MDANLLAMLSTFDEKDACNPRLTCANENYVKEPTPAKDMGQVVPNLRDLLVVIAVGEDMVDGPRVHSEQLVSLEDRVQYRRCDVGRPAYTEQALVFHGAPILFYPFI